MKPKKNRVYCIACNKPKMVFESREKADNFLRFNYSEISEENETAPIRSYYCQECGAYHVTSKIKQRPKNQELEGHEEDFFICSQGSNSDFNSLIDTLESKVMDLDTYIHYFDLQKIDSTIIECTHLIEEIKKYPLDRFAYCALFENKILNLSARKDLILSVIKDIECAVEKEDVFFFNYLSVIKLNLNRNGDVNNSDSDKTVLLYPPIVYPISLNKPETVYFYLKHINNLFVAYDYYYCSGEYEMAVSTIYYAKYCFKPLLNSKETPQYLIDWFSDTYFSKMNQAKKVISLPLISKKQSMFQRMINNILNKQRMNLIQQLNNKRKEEVIKKHNKMIVDLINSIQEIDKSYSLGDVNRCKNILTECKKIIKSFTLIRMEYKIVFDQINKWEVVLGLKEE